MPLLARISNWFTEANDADNLEAALCAVTRIHGQPAPAIAPHDALDELRLAIAPTRDELLAHRIYRVVDSLPRLRRFMCAHVYAVWDFMCMAKRLQRDFTSLDTLWLPPRRPALARFINGLILGEESDVDPDGDAASHLDLYLSAMTEVGAPTSSMRRFLSLLVEGAELPIALAAAGAPAPARAFVASTLDCVQRGTTVEVLASFLFGREDLIPEMFSRLLPRWGESRAARGFAYYVERHIALDGDDHGPAAQRALTELCGTDPGAWRAARRAAEQAIRARLALWDGVVAELR